MEVSVRDNNVEQALRVLKKKMQREGVFREVKLRNCYEKPSEVQRKVDVEKWTSKHALTSKTVRYKLFERKEFCWHQINKFIGVL